MNQKMMIQFQLFKLFMRFLKKFQNIQKKKHFIMKSNPNILNILDKMVIQVNKF